MLGFPKRVEVGQPRRDHPIECKRDAQREKDRLRHFPARLHIHHQVHLIDGDVGAGAAQNGNAFNGGTSHEPKVIIERVSYPVLYGARSSFHWGQ